MAVDRFVKLPVYDQNDGPTGEEIHIAPHALRKLFKDAQRTIVAPKTPTDDSRWQDIPFSEKTPIDYEINREGLVREKDSKLVCPPIQVGWTDAPQVRIPIDFSRTFYVNPERMARRLFYGESVVEEDNTYLRDFKIAQEALVSEMDTAGYRGAITSRVKARILLERLIDDGWQAPKND